MLLNMLRCTGWVPQQRATWPQRPRLRNSLREHWAESDPVSALMERTVKQVTVSPVTND